MRSSAARRPERLVGSYARMRCNAVHRTEDGSGASHRDTTLPPAVEAVCVPWPCVVTQRVEFPGLAGVDAGISALAGVEPLRADKLLVAHRSDERLARSALAVPAGDLLEASLPSLVPLPFAPVRSVKLRLSGQMPESIMPMMIPSPALTVPPSWSHRPPGASSPMNVGVDDVVDVRIRSLETDSTPGVERSLSTCAGVRSAAKPLNV